MKKAIITAAIILTGLLSQAQTKDSVVYDKITDSLVVDANEFLTLLKKENIGINDYEKFQQLLNTFIGYSANKRKKIVKTKLK